MPEQDAVFSEVLEIAVDLPSLQHQLDQFVTMYRAAIAKAGEGAPAFISSQAISSFKSELGSIQKDLRDFASVLQDTLNAAATTVADTAAKATKSADSAVRQATSKVKDTSYKRAALPGGSMTRRESDAPGNAAAKENAAWWADQEAAREKDLTQLRAYIQQRYALEDELKSKQAQKSNETEFADAEEARAKDLAQLRSYIQEKYKDEASYSDQRAKQSARDNEAEFKGNEEARARELSELRRYIQEKYKVQAKEAEDEKELADRAKRAGIQDQVTTIQSLLQGARQDVTGANKAAGRKGAAQESRDSAAAAKEQVQQLTDALGMARQAARDLDTEMAKTAVDAAKIAAEGVAANRATAENASANPVGRFARLAVGNLEELFAGVVKFQVAWAAVGKVIEGVAAIIESPIVALKQGIEYLNLMEEKEDQLTAVFNLTARFSGDTATNLRKSQEAAVAVNAELRQISATKGLNFDSLFNATKSLSENGGIAMVGDMQQLVQLAEMFSAAVKAARGDINTQRMILSQIPNLLAGNVAGANQILQILGLTSAQWQTIRDSSLQHHDLVQQLEPLMRPYMDVLKIQVDDQTNLTEQLKLMVNEAEAHFAKGLWEAWTAILKNSRDYLVENKEVINEMAEIMGSVISDFLQLFNIIFRTEGATNNLVSATGRWAVFLATVATGFGEIARVVASLGVMLNGLSKAGLPAMMGDFDKAKAALSEMSDKLNAIREQGDKAAGKLMDLEDRVNHTGKFAGDQNKDQPAILTAPVTSKRNPPDKGKDNAAKEQAQNDRAHFEEQLANAAEVRQAKVDAAQYEYSERRINEQQLHDLTMSALKEEQAQIQEILAVYKQLIDRNPDFDKTRKDTAKTQANTQVGRIDAGLVHSEAQSDDKLNNTNFGISLDRMRADLEESKRLSALKIETAKAEEASLADVARMEARAHQEEAAAEQAILQKQLGNEAQGSRERIRLQTELNNNIRNAALEASADRQNITNKQLEDTLKDSQEAFEKQSQPMRENLQRMEETMTNGGNNTSNKQHEALSALAAEFAVVNEEQVLYYENLLKMAQQSGAGAAAIDKITVALLKQKAAAGAAQNNAVKDERNARRGDLANVLFGGNVTEFKQFGKLPGADGNIDKNSSTDFGTAVQEMQHAFEFFSADVTRMAQSLSHGNNLAAAGTAASMAGDIANSAAKSGVFGEAITGVLSKAGPIASIAGSVISVFSSIFTAQAKKIADDIKRAFDATVTAYQNGAATLVTTMQQVEAERADAISRLSGKKGGQDQLNQILPQLDQEIAQLKNQAAQIQESFANNLAKLRLNNGMSSDPLSSMLQSWQQINDQIQQYISAGGSAKDAQEALSLTLKEIQHDAYTNLNDGQKTAIQDAQNLNQLLQQRIDLQNQYQEQVNSLLSGDSLQRRASQGVTAGMKIQELQTQYNIQKQQIDDQISLSQQEVDAYRQIYDIKTTTADLDAQSNQANLVSLQQQIQLLKDYQAIYSNISLDPSTGRYAMNSSFQQSIGAVNISIDGSALTQQQMTDAVTQALQNAGRAGLGSSFAQFNN